MAASKRKRPAPSVAVAVVRRELDVHRHELAAQNEELRRANGELTTAKERYAELYDGAPTAYFTLDEAGLIIEANRAGADLLSAPRNVLFGRCFDEVVVAASRASFRNFRRRLTESGGRLAHETTLTTGARRVPVRIDAALVGGDPRAAPEYLLSVTDESHGKQLEAERRMLEARVAEGHRVESLVSLAGAVAHDLEDMLSVVLAQAELLSLGSAGSADRRDAVRQLRDAALRGAELSKQMVAYCGRERLRSEPLDVSAIVGEVRQLLAQSLPPNVELGLELAVDLPLVIGDGVRLQDCVLDLVANAAEAIAPRAGRIVVRTLRSGPAAVVIECSDDGRGMEPHIARRVFDPYFTTKPGGRGLGLAVVHGTVRAHGGSVGVESAAGKGSTFRILLPAALAGSPSNGN